MRLLAIDPGESTGWARWIDGVRAAQGTIKGGRDGFIAWARKQKITYDVLVIEDFIVEPKYTGRAWSSEVLGAAVALIPHRKLVLQGRSRKADLFHQKAKGDSARETERFRWLRNHGFTGTSHELDANTHALLFLKLQKEPGVLKRYWDIGPGNQESPA